MALDHPCPSHRICSALLCRIIGNQSTARLPGSGGQGLHLKACPDVSSLRSQAFMQSSLSQPSMMLSGPSLHSYPGVQAPDLGKPQSSLAYQQPSSTQHIPILFEPQLNQPSGMGGSQLIDTHLLQVAAKRASRCFAPVGGGGPVLLLLSSVCHSGATGAEPAFKSVLRAGSTTRPEQLL